MLLLSIDDFILDDWSIDPALITKDSAHLNFGSDRRAGVHASVFFGSSAQPASWQAKIKTPSQAARDALMAVLAAPGEEQVRLIADLEVEGVEGEQLVWIDASVGSVRWPGSGWNLEVTFESNTSIWLGVETETASKTFTSALDQIVYLPAPGNVPTQPVIRITPTEQRSATTAAVGWSWRQRWMVANNGDEPLFRYPVLIPLGDTTGLTTTKALASGDDLRVWLHGLEQARALVDWDTSDTGVWVIVPALPAGEAITYEIVYGNASANPAAEDGVELIAPDLPAFDMDESTNYQHHYLTANDVINAGKGLWPLSSPLEGGSADFGAPGAWSKALTFENPNNTDSYVQPSAQRLEDSAGPWYQARLYAARWRGDGFTNFDPYAGSDPYDGTVLHNPFGIRAVRSDGIRYRNDAYDLTTVTTTVGDTTETSEVLTPHDPPYTRVVVLGRNGGGENWHVLQEYGNTTIDPLHRLYLQGVTAAPVSPTPAAGWEAQSAYADSGAFAAVAQHLPLGQIGPFTPDASGTSANDDILLAQYVYALPPGVEFTTGDTVKGQVRAVEDDTGDDVRAQMTIRVMTADSTVRATLLDFDTGSLANEFATSATNRRFPRAGTVNLAANYTSVDGDYLVMEYGVRRHASSSGRARLFLGMDASGEGDLPEDESTTDQDYPWIEFSTDLSGEGYVTDTPAWTPPTPVKHFGVAVWPQGVVSIPEDAESRVSVEATGDITVHIAAENLIVAQIEPETEIYELATELRLRGGGNAVGPYSALLVGNARSMNGPGTPRAAVALGETLEIDTERRTHQVWDEEPFGLWEPADTYSASDMPVFLFSPDISGLSDTDPVASWPDSSGNANHAAQGTSGSQPTYQADELNGHPAVRFDGTDDHLETPVFSLNQPYTVIMLAKDISITGNDGYWAKGSHIYRQETSGTDNPQFVIAAAGNVVFTGSSIEGLTWHTSILSVNGDSTALRWDGTPDAGSATPTLTSNPGNNAFRVGVSNTTAYSNIDMAVLAVIDRVLTTAEAQVWEGFLAHTFGLTGSLPSDHPYKTSPPPQTTTNVKVEDLSAHTVRALAGSLREVDATDIPALERIPQTVPNGTFASDLTGWELHQDDGDWTYAVTHDAAVGGEAAGSLEFAVTVSDASTVLWRSTTYLAVEDDDSLEVACWLRQDAAGSSSPRLGVAWYDATPTLIQTDLDGMSAALLNPGADHTLVFAGVPPAGATQGRIVLGVTASGDTATTKYFDDVEAAIIRPLRYDGAISKVTEEARSSRWLPLAPARRTVPNGDFASDLTGWALEDDGVGIAYTVSHDAAVGGVANGSLSIDITGNTGSDSVVYRTTAFFAVNGAQRVQMSAWCTTDDDDVHPRQSILWYGDADDTVLATSIEADWQPVVSTEYVRAFAAIVPPGMTRFRLALVADTAVAEAVGEVHWDDIRLNDADLFVADVSSGGMTVEATVQPRWTP